jgi:NADPH:quinone reductase-like Zn-dependent oxidoreductase
VVGQWIRMTSSKTVRLITLKPNQDLAYLSERLDSGQLVPVIDGPYTLEDAPAAFRHFGAGHHQGKVVITIQ